MQNLDQIRAAAAIKAAAGLKRSAISKLPGLILSNGLLAAAAFADAEGGGDNRGHLKSAMIATAKHLASREIAAPNTKDISDLIRDLSQKDSLTLQRATTESLAFLAFLKRFALKD
jgi:CRISPR/Cas system CMR-associated protein Cmr5 small subunit